MRLLRHTATVEDIYTGINIYGHFVQLIKENEEAWQALDRRILTLTPPSTAFTIDNFFFKIYMTNWSGLLPFIAAFQEIHQ